MPLIAWDNKYSVKVAKMDDEHKKLIGYINQLHDAMLSGKTQQEIAKVLDGLFDYTKTHFADEEKLMQTNQYPGYIAQKVQHDAFIKKAKEFKDSADKGKSVSIELSQFLKDWLINHIQKMDAQYGDFFNKKGIK
jgi:hemerythrin